MNRVILLMSGSVTLAAGCGGDSTESASSTTVRDSAGVTIVENNAPMHSGDGAWRVARDPSLTVGGLAANPEEELYRVNGAVRLDDGRIVIANAGSAELRFFEADGTWLRSVGSRGGGPGEFLTLSSIRRYGTDSLVVLDGEQRRASFYDLDGNLGRMATLIPSEAGGLPFLGATFGVFGDGTFFLSTIDLFSARREAGAMRGTEPVFRISETGPLLDSLGSFPGREMFIRTSPRGVRSTMRIFGRSSYYAVTADHFFVGTTDRYEIARYSPTGSLQMLIRTNRRPAAVEGHHRNAFMEARVADLDTQARIRYEERYEGNEPPGTFPAFGQLLADRDGNLWVSNYRPPDEPDRRFSVFGREGHWLTEVDVPDDISVLEIGADYVLALWTGDLDVEYVRLYALERD